MLTVSTFCHRSAVASKTAARPPIAFYRPQTSQCSQQATQAVWTSSRGAATVQQHLLNMEAGWLSQSFAPPSGFTRVDESKVPKPTPVPLPTQLSGSMVGLRTDEELARFVGESKGGGTAVVEFGTTWCVKCHEMFPQFFALTKKYPQHKYAVAQVETMQKTVSSIKFTPTFGIYRNGKKVDEVVGKEPQKLEDHLWLHTD